MAKIIAYGPDRRSALERLRRAIRETEIDGVANNLSFHADVLADPEFAGDGVDTSYVPRLVERQQRAQESITHA